MKTPLLAALLAAVVLLGGCASVPSGPSVLVLPGTNRDYTEFRDDDMLCRQYASQQVGAPDNDPAVRNALIGTVIGAAAGAAIGGNHRGAGAGVGAGTGLLFGSIAGAEATQRQGYGSQRQYDNVYIQCMYGKGHRVPVAGGMTSRRVAAPVPSAASSAAPSEMDAVYPPPPPAGMPPAEAPADYPAPR